MGRKVRFSPVRGVFARFGAIPKLFSHFAGAKTPGEMGAKKKIGENRKKIQHDPGHAYSESPGSELLGLPQDPPLE